MSTNPDDGGPAFPIPVARPFGDGFLAQCSMSMRDYFAADVLPKLINSDYEPSDISTIGETIAEEAARKAYAYADAMLARRKQP